MSELSELAQRLVDYIRLEIEIGVISPDDPVAVAWRDYVAAQLRAPAGVSPHYSNLLRRVKILFEKADIEFPEVPYHMSDTVLSRQEVLDIFHGRCFLCGQSASTVHEIEPRARGGASMRTENRAAICNDCHEECHRHGAGDEYIAGLQLKRKNFLVSIGRAEYG